MAGLSTHFSLLAGGSSLIKANKWFMGVRKAVSKLSSGKYTLEEAKNLHRMLDEFASKSRMESTVWKLGERTCWKVGGPNGELGRRW